LKKWRSFVKFNPSYPRKPFLFHPQRFHNLLVALRVLYVILLDISQIRMVMPAKEVGIFLIMFCQSRISNKVLSEKLRRWPFIVFILLFPTNSMLKLFFCSLMGHQSYNSYNPRHKSNLGLSDFTLKLQLRLFKGKS
jgi:hypothetical protein